VGPVRGKALLRQVWHCPQAAEPELVYEAEEGAAVVPHDAAPLGAVDFPADSIRVEVETPLRIQKRRKIVSHDMTARDFLMSLVRRYYLLQEFHTSDYRPPDFRALAAAAEMIGCETRLRWCDWHRFSHRQQQKMVLGGVLGRITLRGNLTPFLPLLHAGQWIHAGNKTTFGMGRYVRR
jgi:CRISPR-associated endoribonuclease Cas6